jgi:hypothetical protein
MRTWRPKYKAAIASTKAISITDFEEAAKSLDRTTVEPGSALAGNSV